MKRYTWVVVAIFIVLGLVLWQAKVIKTEKSSSGKVVEIVTWEGELVGDDASVKIAREIRAEFDRTHPNIKVIRRSAPSGDERKVFATAMAGGTAPD